MIKEYLVTQDGILTMDYNPWFYGANTEAITKSFFKSIKEKLEKSGWLNRESMGEVLSIFGSLVPYGGGAIENIGETLTTETLTKTRDKVGAILNKHNKKIVVFIDDIDRLDRQEIQTLFKLVRLSGGFDYTTYVLAFDDTIVAEALGEAYGTGDPVAGRRFLEKIVQVPLHLPAANPEILRRLMLSACEHAIHGNGIALASDEEYELANGLTNGFVHALKTPRQVKLFENAITFAVPILKDEVRLVDQLLIEATRVFYPSIYEAIRKNPKDLIWHQERQNPDNEPPSPIDVAINAIEGSHVERTALRELIADLFPMRSGMEYGNEFETEWAREKRVCSHDYFRRYFTYAVPTGDMPDTAVTAMIKSAAAGDQQVVDAAFDNAIERKGLELLIRKLGVRKDELPLIAVRPITLSLVRRTTKIPTTGDIFLGDYNFIQASSLV